MTLPGLVRANNLNDVVDRERAWDNLGSSLATGDIAIPAPSLDLNFAANKSLVDDISGNNLITFSRASTGTFIGSNGLIQTAASGVPRFDHNPTTGESLGLLVEEARTNTVVSSSVFNTGSWTQDGAVLTANAGVAPDGTTTATSISQGTGNNRCYLFDNSGVTGSKVFSFFVKANAGTSFQITAVGGLTPNATATVNLSSVTVSGFTGATIQAFANGWYRVFLPVLVTTASGGSTYWQIFGPASSVFLWGAQLEAGSFSTSYIPTVASTVTRAADVASITGANFSSWYRQDGGTMLIDTEKQPSSVFYVMMSNANFRSALITQRLNSPQLLVAANYNEINVYSAFNDTPRLKWAIYFSAATLRGSANGNAIASATGTITTSFDRLSFAGLSWEAPSATAAYGSVRFSRFTYYPARLTDPALQYITQPSITAINLYAFNYVINGKDVLALNAVRNASTRNFIFIKGLLSAAQPRLTTAAASTSSALTLATNALPKLSPTSSGNYFFASGITLSGVTTRINGTNALSIATSPFSGSTATAPLLFRELRPQANWRFTEPMPSGTIASPEFAIPFETNDFVLFMKTGPN